MSKALHALTDAANARDLDIDISIVLKGRIRMDLALPPRSSSFMATKGVNPLMTTLRRLLPAHGLVGRLDVGRKAILAAPACILRHRHFLLDVVE